MNGLVVLDFADEMHIGPVNRVLGNHKLSQLYQIGFITSKRYSYVVYFVLKSELGNIIGIETADCW